jgi:hypothetical protein
MAEVKEVFPIVADFASEEGQSLHSIQSGVAPSTRRGIIGFSFKDSSGNVVLPQLDSQGRILTSSEGAGVEYAADGELAAGSLSMADITGAAITLTADKTYSKLQATVSCFRESVFHIVQIDDATTEILARVRVGPGQYTFTWNGGLKQFTAGSTGTQTLKVMGQNLDKASAMS